MADQVNPLGGLASGLPVTLAPVASPTRPAPAAEKAPSNPSPASRSELVQAPPGAPISTEAAVERINTHLQQTATELKMQVDKATGRVVYQVRNQATGEVLLQVPSEEVLAMARNLHALDSKAGTSGVLVDKKG